MREIGRVGNWDSLRGRQQAECRHEGEKAGRMAAQDWRMTDQRLSFMMPRGNFCGMKHRQTLLFKINDDIHLQFIQPGCRVG